MAKIIITLLLCVAPLQAQNTWVSGSGGGDTTGIVHNAIRIKGKFVSLIPPTDNQILKFDAAVDSFKLEADLSAASGSDSIFHTATIHDLDLDSLFFDPEGFASGATNGVGTRVLQYKDGSDELFAIDSLGAVVTGIWSGTVDNRVLLLSAILDSLNNYDNDVLFTQGITLLAANSVSSDELNATGVESELEAVLDLPELQGLLISTQVDSVGGNGIVTNQTGLLLASILDTLNNYDNDVLFTQGVTLLNTDAVSANELNATGVEAELEAVLDLPELQGLLISTQVDSVGGNGIVTNQTGFLLSAILDTLNNYDSDIAFTQGITTIVANSIDSDSYIDGSIDNEHLVDNAVNSQELAAAAVTQAKFGFHAWEKTITFPDTLKSATGNDTLWFGRNNFGATITVDSIYGEADVDNFDFSIVKTDADGKSPTLIDAVQIITAGPSHFRHTETTISSASVAAGSRMGIVLTTDNADYVTFIIYAAW